MKDITGQKWNYLTALKFLRRDKHSNQIWLWKCDCGNEKEISLYNVINSRGRVIKSCGCFKNSKKLLIRKRLYKIWLNMKQRCYDKNTINYKYYGDRGITIYEEWLNKENGFINFYNWATQNGYKEGLSIDRINNDGNYEPDNCKWSSIQEQQQHKRTTNYLTYHGKTQNLMQWSKELNIPYSSLLYRYKQKFSIEQILNKDE